MVDGWPTQFFESLMCIYQSRPPPPDSAYVLVCNYMMQDTEYGQPTEEDQQTNPVGRSLQVSRLQTSKVHTNGG